MTYRLSQNCDKKKIDLLELISRDATLKTFYIVHLSNYMLFKAIILIFKITRKLCAHLKDYFASLYFSMLLYE